MASRLGTVLLAFGLALVAVNWPWHPPGALAAGLDTQGEADAKEATRLYKEGNYDEAAKLFARLTVDYPDMLIFERSLGACFYYLRKPEPALSNLRNYLNHRKDVPADDKAVVERWIDEMEKLRAQNTAPVAPAATAVAPAAQPLPVPAPPPVAPAAALDLAAPATPTPGASEARPVYRNWWFWTGTAAIVAAGTISAILLSRGSSNACDGLNLACRGVK